MKDLFFNNSYDEQETNINIDYSNSKIYLYTSRKTTFERIKSKLGEPVKTYYIKNKVTGREMGNIFFRKEENYIYIV